MSLGWFIFNIYPVYVLLELVKVLVCWNKSHGIAKAKGGQGISERSFSSFGDGPVMMMCINQRT